MVEEKTLNNGLPANHQDDKKDSSRSDSDGMSPDVERLEQVPPGYGEVPVDKEREKHITKKLDKRIVPMVMWVYLMNMMDRGGTCLPPLSEFITTAS